MATRRARLRAYAKLNLSLEVLNRRPDGFHNIRTVFQTISLHDVIHAEVKQARFTKVEVSASVEIPGENLIVRAAHRVLEECGVAAEVRFVLHKRIPMGGGLGGGSADAAAVLMSLPRLLDAPLPPERLHAIAASLGSDVPFFLMGGTAVGLGRGTELYALPDAQPASGLLITPGVHVSTPEAYKALGRTREVPEAGGMSAAERLSSAIANGQPWGEYAVNDFETAVFARHTELAGYSEALKRQGANPVRMTGSGSTLFGLFLSPQQRSRAAELFGDAAVPFTFVSRRRYLRDVAKVSLEN